MARASSHRRRSHTWGGAWRLKWLKSAMMSLSMMNWVAEPRKRSQRPLISRAAHVEPHSQDLPQRTTTRGPGQERDTEKTETETVKE